MACKYALVAGANLLKAGGFFCFGTLGLKGGEKREKLRRFRPLYPPPLNLN